jgi:hypothetical protein
MAYNIAKPHDMSTAQTLRKHAAAFTRLHDSTPTTCSASLCHKHCLPLLNLLAALVIDQHWELKAMQVLLIGGSNVTLNQAQTWQTAITRSAIAHARSCELAFVAAPLWGTTPGAGELPAG